MGEFIPNFWAVEFNDEYRTKKLIVKYFRTFTEAREVASKMAEDLGRKLYNYYIHRGIKSNKMKPMNFGIYHFVGHRVVSSYSGHYYSYNDYNGDPNRFHLDHESGSRWLSPRNSGADDGNMILFVPEDERKFLLEYYSNKSNKIAFRRQYLYNPETVIKALKGELEWDDERRDWITDPKKSKKVKKTKKKNTK